MRVNGQTITWMVRDHSLLISSYILILSQACLVAGQHCCIREHGWLSLTCARYLLLLFCKTSSLKRTSSLLFFHMVFFFSGHGIFTGADGVKYGGGFKAGSLHGRGVYEQKDGRKYDGEFVGNRRNGE